MPEVYQRNNAASLDAVLAEFDTARGHLSDLGRETQAIVEKMLAEEGLKVHSVQHRVKTKDKLKTKYSDATKDYVKLTDITDLVGFRIITYYEDEIDTVADLIRREFALDPRCIDKRNPNPDSFWYSALHLVCSYSESRIAHPEYRAYSGDCFEIQITSILRHAWSEMEHGWYDLRDNFPQKIKRRYSRLVALLEIVEEEFVELRKLKKQLEGSAAARVKAEMPNVAIDSASLGAFIEQEPLVQELDVSIAAILGCELDQARSEGVLDLRIRVLASSGVKTVENLRELLKRYQKELLAYVADCQPLWARTAPMGTTYEKGICLFHLGMMLIAADSRLRQAIQELGVDLVQSPQSIDEQSRIAMRLLDRTIAGQ